MALGFGWVTQAESGPSCSLAGLSPTLPREPILKAEVGLWGGRQGVGPQGVGCLRTGGVRQEGLCAVHPFSGLRVFRSHAPPALFPGKGPCCPVSPGPLQFSKHFFISI